MIRMIAIDLDDTLLRSDLTVSFRVRNMVKRAAKEGIMIVLATGRIPAATEFFARLLGMNKRNGYFVCSNGTLIMESKTKNVIFETKMSVEAALTAFDLVSAEGFAVQLYKDDVMFVSKTNEFTIYDQKLTGLKQVVAEDFRDLVAKGCDKLLIPGDPLILPPLESILNTYLGDEITLFTSKPYFLEILPPRTDKGVALAKIAAKLGIKREEVMAIGDSMNDVAMLKWAGTGVAMLNADERIKKIADLVSEKTNDDDGVADVIEKLLGGRL
ncbi:MAG: Cof-type HAD-IIB family hydrolase [Treponema sp.]|nr:Cof-type HAD-IIB family hydrolase [Treponema sp.]